MRRADRLFQIIQNLHHTRSTTARYLAEQLEVSERTIYRDIQDLSLSGVPIVSETGTGYRLLKGFQLPPLMFNEDEIAALLLGAQMVKAWTDKGLSKSAHQAMQKIESILPEKLKPELERHEIIVPDFSINAQASEQLSVIRKAVKNSNKTYFEYSREDGEKSMRTVRPLGLFYWGKVWTLVAWCELRDSFRHFRLDRMSKCAMLDETFIQPKGKTLDDFLNNEWGVTR